MVAQILYAGIVLISQLMLSIGSCMTSSMSLNSYYDCTGGGATVLATVPYNL